jgi:hypothetical protein
MERRRNPRYKARRKLLTPAKRKLVQHASDKGHKIENERWFSVGLFILDHLDIISHTYSTYLMHSVVELNLVQVV